VDDVPDEDDEGEEDVRRPRRRRRFRGGGEPHRGALILVLGIISIVCSLGVCCGLFAAGPTLVGLCLGIPAIVMGRADLRKIGQGAMDESGHGLTMGGFVCGIIGTILNGICLIIGIIFLIFYIGLFAAAATQQHNKFPQQQFPRRGPNFQVDPRGLPQLQDYLPRRSFGSGVGGPGL
jgi:hypothetical protein